MPLITIKFLLYVFSLALLTHGKQEVFGLLATTQNSSASDPISICNQIAAAISCASQVYFPRECIVLSFGLRCCNLTGNQATPEYLLDLSHASASSSETSVCSVEPGSTEDVSKIVSW